MRSGMKESEQIDAFTGKGSFIPNAVRCGMCRTTQIHGIQWECLHRTRCGAVPHRAARCVVFAAYRKTPRRTATHPV